MNQIQINNTAELLDFINREEVTSKQATQIVCKALKVVSIFEMTKQELIIKTEYHINKFCNNDAVGKPIFLGQRNFQFSINDIYKNDTATN